MDSRVAALASMVVLAALVSNQQPLPCETVSREPGNSIAYAT